MVDTLGVVRPFRFAVQLRGGRDGPAWRARACQLEDLGYSTLFVPDHFRDQWAPLVALTTAAEATTTLRIGSLVFDNDYRHPVELAREIATLDLVSEGRVEVGLGAGWMKSDYDELGIAYDRPGVRIDRLVEGLRIMNDLWVTGTSTRRGSHYQVTEAQGVARPTGAACPPVIIGGGGKRVLTIAAGHADIIGFNPSLPEGRIGPQAAASATAQRFRERVAWVREAAGERLGALEFQVLTFLVQVTADRAKVFADAAPVFGLAPEDLADVPLALVGTIDQIIETLEVRRQEFGFSYWVVHDEDVEAFAPVVAALAGT